VPDVTVTSVKKGVQQKKRAKIVEFSDDEVENATPLKAPKNMVN
jgi:hypothetical protein